MYRLRGHYFLISFGIVLLMTLRSWELFLPDAQQRWSTFVVWHCSRICTRRVRLRSRQPICCCRSRLAVRSASRAIQVSDIKEACRRRIAPGAHHVMQHSRS